MTDITPLSPAEAVADLNARVAAARSEVARLSDAELTVGEDLDPVEQKDMLNAIRSELDRSEEVV